jgi:hypothetical protein
MILRNLKEFCSWYSIQKYKRRFFDLLCLFNNSDTEIEFSENSPYSISTQSVEAFVRRMENSVYGPMHFCLGSILLKTATAKQLLVEVFSTEF